MAAATGDRDGQRQPSELVPYTGSSGYKYYKETLIMKSALGPIIQPLASGAGASNARFLGVANNRVDLSAGLGSSHEVLNLWKTGEFTFVSNGNGASAHIGQRAYALDDQTVGVSIAVPALYVGEIVGMPTTTSYRVRIDSAINGEFISGLSGFSLQN